MCLISNLFYFIEIFSPIPNTSQNRNSSEYESISIMPSTGDSTEQIVTSTGNLSFLLHDIALTQHIAKIPYLRSQAKTTQ